MQLTLEAAELAELIGITLGLSKQLASLQTSLNQLLTGEKNIMGALAQLTAVDQAIDAAVTALTAEEGSLAAGIQSAITFIEGLVTSGSITSQQAAPIIADLQTQATNIQNVTAALTGAQSSLASATAPPAGSSGSSTSASSPSSTEPTPAPTPTPGT
jgi:hypothetical protein